MKTTIFNSLLTTTSLMVFTASPILAQEGQKMPHNMPADNAPDLNTGAAATEVSMNQGDRKGMSYSKLVAIIGPVGDSNVKGSVTFEQQADGVLVTADVGGFEPNTKHGFHVHEFGDLGSQDATSAGGHFNPSGHDHALPDTDMRHGGDLGNLSADENGHAKLSLVVKNITLGAGKTGILGRAVIIHAKEDDGGQPTGNAGDRIAAGVIGISKDGVAEPAKGKKGMKMHKMDKSPEAPADEHQEMENPE